MGRAQRADEVFLDSVPVLPTAWSIRHYAGSVRCIMRVVSCVVLIGHSLAPIWPSQISCNYFPSTFCFLFFLVDPMRTTWKPAEIGTLLIIGVLLMIDYDRCSCLVMKSFSENLYHVPIEGPTRRSRYLVEVQPCEKQRKKSKIRNNT